MNAPSCGKGRGMGASAIGTAVVGAPGAAAWVPVLAARTLEKKEPHPRVPREPRRKAAMLDNNGDGNLNLLLLDSTGDGVPDQPVASVGVDTTGDGRTDALIADSNGDGRGDCLVIDTSGDGIPDIAFDVVLVDTDNDGQADVILVDRRATARQTPSCTSTATVASMGEAGARLRRRTPRWPQARFGTLAPNSPKCRFRRSRSTRRSTT